MTEWVSVWVVALVLALLAPWAVQLFANAVEARVRKRTQEVLGRARLDADAPRGAGLTDTDAAAGHRRG